MRSTVQGGDSLELRSGDFPSAGRLLPIQVASGEAAAARHRHVLLVVSVIVLQKDWVVILFLLWVFL
jgi:hypothetical protein